CIKGLQSICAAGNSCWNDDVPRCCMKRVCYILTYPVWTVVTLLLFTGCGETDAGLKQRIAESDAQRATAETRVKDLEKQVEALRQQGGTPAATSERPPEKQPEPVEDATLAALG